MKKLIILSSILILLGLVSFLFFTKSTISATEIVESKDKYVCLVPDMVDTKKGDKI